MVPADGLAARVTGPRYAIARFLQVVGLMVTLVAATAFFGTPSTIAMLRMMLAGVVIFIAGWVLLPKE